VDDIPRKPASAAPCHLVPSGKECLQALADVVVDAAERGNRGPQAEVVRAPGLVDGKLRRRAQWLMVIAFSFRASANGDFRYT
jgi:hypothetical protein